MLRRLEKRILVDLPTYEARRCMFKHHLPPVVSSKEGGLELLSEIDYDVVAVVRLGLWHFASFLFFINELCGFLIMNHEHKVVIKCYFNANSLPTQIYPLGLRVYLDQVLCGIVYCICLEPEIR